jgi:uncharacterized protein
MPNPFAHIELTTDDLKAAQKFYGKVFAWNLKEMPGMNYTMIDVGTGTGGGMQLRPMPDAPTGWMPYVQVDDVKATVAKAAKAGATVLLPYQEIGGNMGSLGVFKDPNGSVIGVWAAPAEATPAPAAAAPKKKAPAKAKAAPAKKAAAPAKKAAAPAKKAAAPAKKAPAKKVAAPAKKAGKK